MSDIGKSLLSVERVFCLLLLLGCLILSLGSHLPHACPVVDLGGPLVIITKLSWSIVWKCLPSVDIRQNFPKTITFYHLDKLYSLITLGTFDLCPSIFHGAQFALNGILHSWKPRVGELESGGKEEHTRFVISFPILFHYRNKIPEAERLYKQGVYLGHSSESYRVRCQHQLNWKGVGLTLGKSWELRRATFTTSEGMAPVT